MQRVSALIISIYITAFIYMNAFFIKPLTIAKGADQLFWNHLAIFIILLVPVYLLISDMVMLPSTRLGVLLLPIALLGLVVALFYHVIPLEPIYNLPAQVDRFFAPDYAFTAWLIAPLLALFI